MHLYNFSQDTICAIATAPGQGGLAVVRVSGPESVSIVSQILRSHKPLSKWSANYSGYGYIMDGEAVLDDVVVTKFVAPHSFTAEDTVEISCHGSLYIQDKLLQILIDRGCRMAEPGEFTKRAFLNGRIDLSQAEAVADIISARSSESLKLARQQAGGEYSKEFNSLADRLIELTSLMELELDFSEEDVEFADRDKLFSLCSSIYQRLSKLLQTYSTGNAIKEGVAVAIAGPANAGKSTLLNKLLGRDRAIVSDIAGTTRDTIEDTVVLDGILFRLVDTAGLRDTSDTIEEIGIKRTYDELKKADLILYVVDQSALDEAMIKDCTPILESIDNPMLLILNKSDKEREYQYSKPLQWKEYETMELSAKYSDDLVDLKSWLVAKAKLPGNGNDVVVSNTRHYEALSKAADALKRVIDGLQMGITADFLSPDLRICIDHIEEVTGRRISSDTILHHIFSHFCIGK